MSAAAGRDRSLVRFLAVGVVNTAIDVGIYTGLVLTGVPIVISNAISTTAGMTFSFLANRSFTFAATGGTRAQLVRQALVFVVVTGFGLWVIQPSVIWLASQPLGELARQPVGVVFTKLCGVAVALVWNYLLYRFVVFRPAAPSA